jgi:hypothetical protein
MTLIASAEPAKEGAREAPTEGGVWLGTVATLLTDTAVPVADAPRLGVTAAPQEKIAQIVSPPVRTEVVMPVAVETLPKPLFVWATMAMVGWTEGDTLEASMVGAA